MYIIETCINSIYNLCCCGSKRKREEPVKTATEIIYEMERMPKEERPRYFGNMLELERKRFICKTNNAIFKKYVC